MKVHNTLFLLALILCLASCTSNSEAQTTATGKTYQQMTPAERSAFVNEHSRRIAREISGREYEFTSDFIADIQQAVNQYARRIGNNGGDSPGKGDARLVFERGQAQAPALIEI